MAQSILASMGGDEETLKQIQDAYRAAGIGMDPVPLSNTNPDVHRQPAADVRRTESGRARVARQGAAPAEPEKR